MITRSHSALGMLRSIIGYLGVSEVAVGQLPPEFRLGGR